MKFKRHWNWRKVMDLCIKCQWYTLGGSEEYDAMLNFVKSHNPTDRNIIKVATNIYKNSIKHVDRDLESIAFMLGAEAVYLVLELDSKE